MEAMTRESNETLAASAAPAVAPRRRAEAGSAYIIALLVLVVLTIIGLALTLVTQTEVQIGANERTVNRTFYAADSGIAVAVAKVLVSGDYTGANFSLNTTLQDTGTATINGTTTFSDEVTTTPMLPILFSPCNLCQINQKSDYYAITHTVASDGARTGALATGSTTTPLADKRLSVMVSLMPWQKDNKGAESAINDNTGTMAGVSF